MRSDQFILNEETKWSLDGHETKLNANTVIIGSPGTGKSTLEAYNILSMDQSSHVIVDPKGVMSKTRSALENKGYEVLELDFIDFSKSNKYNPFNYIRHNRAEEDIYAFASALYGDNLSLKDPYWDESAKALLRSIIGFVYCANQRLEVRDKFNKRADILYMILSNCPNEQQVSIKPDKQDSKKEAPDNPMLNAALRSYEKEYGYDEKRKSVQIEYILAKYKVGNYIPSALRALKLVRSMGKDVKSVMSILNETHQTGFGYSTWILFELLQDVIGDNLATRQFRGACTSSEKTGASTLTVLKNVLATLNFSKGLDIFSQNEINLEQIGEKKTVVFIRVPDYDTSMHKFLNIFLSQTIQVLYEQADTYADKKLKVPVLFWLDDFGSYQINDFEAIMSTARSRGIGFNLLFQSLGQLGKNYGMEAANTLVQCADTLLYLGGNDVMTISYLRNLTQWTHSHIAYLKPFETIMYQRGIRPKKLKLIDFEKEPEKCIWNYMDEKESVFEDEVSVDIVDDIIFDDVIDDSILDNRCRKVDDIVDEEYDADFMDALDEWELPLDFEGDIIIEDSEPETDEETKRKELEQLIEKMLESRLKPVS